MFESELADGYGNLASRILAMIVRYTGGVIPTSGETMSLDTEGEGIIEEYRAAMEGHWLHLGGQAAWKLVSSANSFVEGSAPWTLHKEGEVERLEAVLAALARALSRITLMASPFLPQKAQQVWEALGQPGQVIDQRWAAVERPEVGGASASKPPPLFPKRAE